MAMNSKTPANIQPAARPSKPADPRAKGEGFRMLFFTDIVKLPVCAGKIKDHIGKLSDVVFRLTEPYPEAVGFYLDHGWGKPTEFIPWEQVVKIEEDAVFVKPAPDGGPYPPFVDQPGWILLDKHLMGRTILDTDGRRTEVVNDVHLLEARGKLMIVHVDVSFNGFLRRWGLGRWHFFKDRLISWKFVQPLSVEDATKTDKVSLSITRSAIQELPGEDLADILEELSGKEQQALFSALDAEKAAETLVEAEPRAQRQIIASLRMERARGILSEMSVAQLANLFTVLPHDDVVELMALLPADEAARIRAILSEREASASALMSNEYVAMPAEVTVAEALEKIRHSGQGPDAISYIYIIRGEDKILEGLVDLRELILAAPEMKLSDLMTSPAVSAQDTDVRDDLTELFGKYHFRMIPVVNAHDALLGVILFKDIMKGPDARS
ncbi:MAG: CBS domain-containing protein [Candidatus Sumerlaeota bacterium]|nr:CBS domain-containing protein [Candidatus Sumerlaeota bacterium]